MKPLVDFRLRLRSCTDLQTPGLVEICQFLQCLSCLQRVLKVANSSVGLRVSVHGAVGLNMLKASSSFAYVWLKCFARSQAVRLIQVSVPYRRTMMAISTDHGVLRSHEKNQIIPGVMYAIPN